MGRFHCNMEGGPKTQGFIEQISLYIFRGISFPVKSSFAGDASSTQCYCFISYRERHSGPFSWQASMSWKEHTENLATSAGKSLDVLTVLKYRLNRVTLGRLYVAFIWPKLEYAGICWDNCSQELDNLLKGVHYRTANIISGTIHRTSHELVYKEPGWECFRERRWKLQVKTCTKW